MTVRTLALRDPLEEVRSGSAQKSLVEKYGAAVPRYTSYPTAPHFEACDDDQIYRAQLAKLQPHDSLSLYLHIPFCDRLCWFCGCNTKQTLKYDPISQYLGYLHREIDLVSSGMLTPGHISSIHFGGGSPSMLRPDDFAALVEKLDEKFHFSPDLELSVEIDPSDVDELAIKAMAEAGMTRASIGVQDFDPEVQKAINRPQSFEQTRAVVDALRAAGVPSINLDVLYGLPLQNEEKITKTIAQVISLSPDRIALFGYAHVPWMKKHQRLIHDADLADLNGRFAQAESAASQLVKAGYVRIGLDHFAKPSDQLAHAAKQGHLKRNFQGYSVDPAKYLIGLGASSIGENAAGYVQNFTANAQYFAALDDGKLPVGKQFSLSDEDRARRWVIERLMCDLHLSFPQMQQNLGSFANVLLAEAQLLVQNDKDGFIFADTEGLHVTEKGRPFLRVLAAHFDAYFKARTARHSVAV